MSTYLVYDVIGVDRAGLHHNLANLSAQIREAVLLGRALVAPPPALSVNHNEGYPSPPEWNRYVDLENSLLHIRYNSGASTICPMPIADLLQYSDNASADGKAVASGAIRLPS